MVRGTRSISSGSSWWWQGVALVVGSLDDEALWESGFAVSPLEGHRPSMCVPPAPPADGSRALH